MGGARHVEGNVSDLLSWQTAATLIPAARSGCAVLVAAGPELRDPLEPQDPPTVRTDILYSADRRETVRTGKTRAPWKQKPSYQFAEAPSSIHRLSRMRQGSKFPLIPNAVPTCYGQSLIRILQQLFNDRFPWPRPFGVNSWNGTNRPSDAGRSGYPVRPHQCRGI